MKKKKALGPVLAIIFVLIILIVGFFLGKSISSEYNKKNLPKKNIFEILKIVKEDKPINYRLVDKTETLSELCGKDTGICDQEVGAITLDNSDIKLYIYSNFDNPEDLATTYFKLNNTKIGSFVYLDKFSILNKKYLIITEPNSYNNNYIIHIYNKTGKELSSYEATNINSSFEIKNNELYFSYCNAADSNQIDGTFYPKVSLFKVSSDNITKKEEVSFEYKVCT